MAAEMTASTAAELRSSSLGRASVRALIASWLGWMFDGYETYALVLVMGSAVHQFLPPDRLPSASVYIGGLLAATMLGWAGGGIAAGILADYFGRRRTLMLSILCYAGLFRAGGNLLGLLVSARVSIPRRAWFR